VRSKFYHNQAGGELLRLQGDLQAIALARPQNKVPTSETLNSIHALRRTIITVKDVLVNHATLFPI